MESASRPRSTRDRPAKAPLSEDVIVDVAMRILRKEGLDAVTMRRVATELDTGPASLYVYVGGRDELREAMLDRVARMVKLEEPDPARWREQLHTIMRGVLEALEAHPGIARVAVANVPTGEGSLLMAENMLSLMLAGGVTPRDAAWAIDILFMITTASAVETAAYQERGQHTEAAQDELVSRLDTTFAALSPSRFPNFTALAHELTSGSGDDRFEFAIDTFLDGLVARAGRSEST